MRKGNLFGGAVFVLAIKIFAKNKGTGRRQATTPLIRWVRPQIMLIFAQAKNRTSKVQMMPEVHACMVGAVGTNDSDRIQGLEILPLFLAT